MSASRADTSNRVLLVFLSVALWLLAAVIFFRIYPFTDLRVHGNDVVAYVNGVGRLPANFLFYWLASVLALGKAEHVQSAVVALLSIAVLAKFLISYRYCCGGTLKKQGGNPLIATLVVFCLVFASPIFIPQLLLGRWYLGSFPPNIWHNSTIVTAMPFSVLLFWVTCRNVQAWSGFRCLAVCALILVNLLIKPSYLFVYCLALPLTVWLSRSPHLARHALITAYCVGLIAIQYYLIYLSDGHRVGSTNSLGLSPFKVYCYWHSRQVGDVMQCVGIFFLSVISSFAFPLVMFGSQGVSRRDVPAMLAISSTAIALVLATVLIEDGPRWWHGNFFWQIYASAFLLFLVATKRLLEAIRERCPASRRRFLNITTRVVFLFHVLFGMAYVTRLILFQQYL